MPEVLLGVGELRLLVDHGVELLERVVAGNFDGLSEVVRQRFDCLHLLLDFLVFDFVDVVFVEQDFCLGWQLHVALVHVEDIVEVLLGHIASESDPILLHE